MSKLRIAVVAFERISPFHLSVPCVIFGDAHPGVPSFEFIVCAVKPGILNTTAGFGIHVTHGLEALASADIIIIPSWRDPAETPPALLLSALTAAAQRGATIVGLCLGAYVLAAAGLLDGRRATTHWAYAADFARRYPLTQVDANVLYIADDRILTSAGTAAGIDCCLYMLRQKYGAETANSVARRLVVPPHRQGGQAQFIEQPVPASANDSRLAELLDWVRSNPALPHTLDSLAQRALMSRRTFTRHFRQLTGSTVGAWLLGQRLALSQRLLEGTEHDIAQIADLTGFASPVTLRHHFRKAFGVSPSAWRDTFNGK